MTSVFTAIDVETANPDMSSICSIGAARSMAQEAQRWDVDIPDCIWLERHAHQGRG